MGHAWVEHFLNVAEGTAAGVLSILVIGGGARVSFSHINFVVPEKDPQEQLGCD
jgi:hypothetical protein